jgi:hypothetical protein
LSFICSIPYIDSSRNHTTKREKYLAEMKDKLREIRVEHDGRPGWIGKNKRHRRRDDKEKRKAGRPRVRRGSDASVDSPSEGEDDLMRMSASEDEGGE